MFNRSILAAFCVAGTIALSACTQESQNKLGRSLQNWTGTDGVLEVYSGNQLVKRFMKIDKLSTATGTSRDVDRPYRFGYGIMDENLDGKVGDGEDEKVYFEFSDYSTPYIFFEQPWMTSVNSARKYWPSLTRLASSIQRHYALVLIDNRE